MPPPHTTRISRQQEKQTAKELGGKRQPGSGNQWHSKGDVKSGKLLIECKVTEGEGYRLTKKDLKEHELSAAQMRREPAWKITFLGPGVIQRHYAVISWERYLELLELESKDEP